MKVSHFRQTRFRRLVRWCVLGIVLTMTALLQTAFAVGIEIDLSSEAVCGEEFSHRLNFKWRIFVASAVSQVTITLTLPDGSTHATTQDQLQGLLAFTLTLPNGGNVEVQIAFQQGGNPTTASTSASLTPCERVSGTGLTGVPSESSDVPNPPPLPFGPDITLPQAPDFEITDIEVSQGIQNLNNDMPLVAARRTIVRVYVKDLQAMGWSGVGARLDGELVKIFVREGEGPDGIDDITLSNEDQNEIEVNVPLGNLLPSNQPGGRIDVQPEGGSRLKLNDSFWFKIPTAWHDAAQDTFPGANVVGYRIRFTAEVNDNRSVEELSYVNNAESTELSFSRAEIFQLRTVPLHLHPDGDPNQPTKIYQWDEADRWDVYLNMFRLNPISDLLVKARTTPLEPLVHDASLGEAIGLTEWNMSDDGQCVALLTEIAWLRISENLPGRQHYMGLVHPDLSTCAWGWALGTDKVSSWVRMDNGSFGNPDWHVRGGYTMAHEIGHNEGRKHVDCNNTEDNTDDDYPYPFPDCRLAKVDKRGYYGLDVYYALWGLSEPTVISNDVNLQMDGNALKFFRASPLMGYKQPPWIDPYTYCNLLKRYEVACNIGDTPDSKPEIFGEDNLTTQGAQHAAPLQCRHIGCSEP